MLLKSVFPRGKPITNYKAIFFLLRKLTCLFASIRLYHARGFDHDILVDILQLKTIKYQNL
jgi:hypothetical protein